MLYLPLFVIISSCQSASSTNRQKTAEEIKQELAQKERENPVAYLKASGTHRKNFIGETVLEGRIINTATVANFKDIVIEADFLAPSGTSLGTKEFTRYELLGPGYDVTFRFKALAPKQTNSVSIRVVTATPVQ